MLSTSALKPQLQFLDKNPQKLRKFGDERIIEKLDFLEYQYQHKESVGGIGGIVCASWPGHPSMKKNWPTQQSCPIFNEAGKFQKLNTI